MQGSDPRKQLLLGPPPLRQQLSLVGLHFWICTGTGSRHRHGLRDALVFFFFFFFFHWRYGQSSTLSSEFFFYRLSQIQQQMKAVGNLSRLRCAPPSSAGIESEPIARDDLHFRMLLQLLRQLVGRALRQQVRYGSSFQIDQDRAVGLSLLPSPVIDTHHPQSLLPVPRRSGPALKPTEYRVVADRHRQPLQEKLSCTSACAVAHQEQHFLHPTGPPCPGRHLFAESLTEDGLFTFPIATSPSTQPQLQRHPLALNRKILQLPPVTTVASGRLRSARRALRSSAALGTDEPTLLGFFELHQGQTYLGWQ